MLESTSRRSGLIAAALAALVDIVVAAAAVIYDQSRKDQLAPGMKIDGVAVGGLDTATAREKLQRLAVTPRRRALTIHAADRTITVPPRRLGVKVDLDAVVDRALAISRRGWIGARVVRGVTGERTERDLPLQDHAAPGVLGQVAVSVSKRADRAPKDASVDPSADGLDVKPAEPGRAVDAAALRTAMAVAISDPRRPADITATMKPIAPKVTRADLAKKYQAYIIVDRKSHQLRFYRHLKLANTYPIAVGKAGLETPPGLYDVQWKEVNPPWHVPNSAWAGKLAGRTIPPGPDDPIKARWLAFNGGAGIHGIDPSEYGSIGHDASHGCVRMRIPDVIALYKRTPVHSPVYVA